MASNNKKSNKKGGRVITINLTAIIYLILIGGIVWMLFGNSGPQPQKIEWQQVSEMILKGDVKEIHFVRNDFKGNVTVKPDRMNQYANLFPGGKVPQKSPQFTFLVSPAFEPERTFAELNAQLEPGDQVMVIMENNARILGFPCIMELDLFSFE